jgi:hypothetical protein
MIRFRLFLVGVLSFLTVPAFAHFDVVPYANGGKIQTGGHDDGTNEDVISNRVFGYDFGEDLMDPYFIGDPGFNNGAFAAGVYPNDGLLPANKTLTFDVITNLLYWDGTGAVDFTPAPLLVSLGLIRGSNEGIVSGTGFIDPTFPTIGSTGSLGRVHVHLGSSLYYDGSIDPSDLAGNAPDGIYMIGMQLKLADDSLAPSDPLYIVYNNGLSESIHDEAIGFVETSVVPEPSMWMLIAGSGLGMLALVLRKNICK